MSLQAAAQHLASRGRGPDSTLVHMAPGEVASLQAIAKAHGGTLTINPDTGLPEAGFLSRLLPMIAGAALTATTGIPAWAIGLGVGGIETARTGSLGKGLMAGLGAYGGAGLMGGLAGAGAAGMNQAATQGILEANPGLTASEIGREMGQAGFVQPQIAASANPATASVLDKASAGFQGLGTEAGRSAALQSLGGTSGALKYGLSAAAPLMFNEQEQTPYAGSGPNPYNYAFDWERPELPYSGSSREAAQLRGNLRPITQMAMGGPVEDMSARNAALTLMSDGGQMFAEGGETKSENKGVMGLGRLTHIAAPEGTINFRTGEVTPWSATNPRPTGGLFDGSSAPVVPPPAAPPSSYRGMTGASADAMRYLMGESAVSPMAQAARQAVARQNPITTMPVTPPAQTAGREADPNQPYNFTFDPITGQMTPIAQATRPIQPTTDVGSYAGGGQINMQGTLNLSPGDSGGGQFGQAAPNGYQPMGSGRGIDVGQMPFGLDPRAIEANPQGFQRYAEQAQQREQQMPGSTFLSQKPGEFMPAVMPPGGFSFLGNNMNNATPFAGNTDEARMRQQQMDMGGSNYRPPQSNSNQAIGPDRTGNILAPVYEALGVAPNGRLPENWEKLAVDKGFGDLVSRSYVMKSGGLASMATGGVSHLGDYSDGGRLLRGPGDGVSDSIPATIADKRPARLADGEFVVPARIVSELGNGSTEAGARKLYAMMDRVQKARGKTTGKGRVAVNSRADKALPA